MEIYKIFSICSSHYIYIYILRNQTIEKIYEGTDFNLSEVCAWRIVDTSCILESVKYVDITLG